MRHPQNYNILLLSFLVLGFWDAIVPSISFANKSSTLRLTTDSYFSLASPLLNFGGTLSVTTTGDTELTGNAVVFTNGRLKINGQDSYLTGSYNSANSSDYFLLMSNNQFKFFDQLTVPPIIVVGPNNIITGMPLFSGSITLSDASTELAVGIGTSINQSIYTNSGTLILLDDLILDKGLTITGTSFVKTNGRSLIISPKDNIWTGTTNFIGGSNIVLREDAMLSGLWTFSGIGACSYLNGNGALLDLTLGGSLWVRSGHSLIITDLVLGGLGNNGFGRIFLEDNTSTVSFFGADVMLQDNYTATIGTWYFGSKNARIISGDRVLTFSANSKLIVDGVTLTSESLNSLPFRGIVPSEDDGINTFELNFGRIRSPWDTLIGEEFYIDYSDFSQTATLMFDASKKLVFRGNRANTMVFNGNGLQIDFNRTNRSMIKIYPGKTAVFTNVILNGLLPEHINTANGTLVFGDGVLIKLSRGDINLSYAWTFTGDAAITGQGQSIIFTPASGNLLQLSLNKTLTLQDIVLENVQTSGGVPSFWCAFSSGKIALDNVTLMLGGSFTFTVGSLNIIRDVTVSGPNNTFGWQSDGLLTVKQNACLKIDQGVLFSYAPPVAKRNLLQLEADQSTLHLSGCAFSITHTGVDLNVGRLIFERNVSLNGSATSFAEGIVLGNSLRARLLPGAHVKMATYVTEN